MRKATYLRLFLPIFHLRVFTKKRGYGIIAVVIKRVCHVNEDKYVERLRNQTGLTEKTIRALFYFQLNGCLAISKQNVNIPDDEWSEIQCHVDRYLRNGFDAI